MQSFRPSKRNARAVRGFLGRMRRETTGNTLAMAAISLIPLTAMIGSGLDMSRAYLVKSRLQSACDAGSLAARKTMEGNVSLTTEATAAGQNFFNNNYPAGTYGTTAVSFTPTVDADNQITATATATLPLTLMKLFRFTATDSIVINVTCSARLDVTNTDVMFVLDTTGSMNDCPDGSTCSGGAGSKIAGLRSAVTDFTNTLSTAAPPTARIRYGFVPYSSTVNVGDVLPSTYINSSWTYRSRVAAFTTLVAPVTVSQTYSSTLSSVNCALYQLNASYPTLDGATISDTDPNGFTSTAVYTARDWGGTGTTSGTNRTCRRYRTITVTPTAYRFTGWTYGATTYDVTAFKDGSAVTYATGTLPSNYYVGASASYNLVQLAQLPRFTNMGGTVATATWANCIEERDTVSNSTFSYGSIPSTAYDLDIDTIPTNSNNSWRAWWPEIVWESSNPWAGTSSPARPFDYAANGFAACPSPAQKLQTMTQSDVQTYVNALTPLGGTYHDVGMIWGARLISAQGIFASENTTAPNGQPISRNIIFMTDGQMAPNPYIYGLYGYEQRDQRVSGGTPSTSDLTSRHNSRFLAMCAAAKAKNISVWVIGFGTTLSTEMTTCANPGQAFQASDTATLRAQFTSIATKIAKLRLSQ